MLLDLAQLEYVQETPNSLPWHCLACEEERRQAAECHNEAHDGADSEESGAELHSAAASRTIWIASSSASS
jgi:hypothetical protein